MTPLEMAAGLYVEMKYQHPEWNIVCEKEASVHDIKITGEVREGVELNINTFINNEPETIDEFNNPYCYDVILTHNGVSTIQGFECSKLGFADTHKEIIEMIEEELNDIE